MPADTTTPILGLLLQGTGNNNNSWGTNLNNSVITPLENATANGLNLAMTGGAYTLTQANAAYAIIVLTGTLTSDLTITVPSVAHSFKFFHALNSSGFVVLIKTAAGTAVNLPHGKMLRMYCDSISMFREDRHSVGEYFFHAGQSAPFGAIECTGAAISRTNYPDLFAQLGTLHGLGTGGTGATFGLPNGTGSAMFLRSRSGANVVGTYQTSQNLSHNHTVNGAPGLGTLTVNGGDGGHTHTGSTTDNDSPDHTHQYTAGDTNNITYPGAVTTVHGTLSTVTQTGGRSTPHTHTFTVQSNSSGHNHAVSGAPSIGNLGTAVDGGAEARPSNITGILCVRY